MDERHWSGTLPAKVVMKFGWLTLAMSPSPDEDCQRIDQIIDQACAAEQMGFSDVWLTEHYFTGESVYNDSLMSPRRSP